MIKAWLDLPAFGIFATLCVLYYGMAIALFALLYHSRLGAPIKSLNGLVAPFFSSVALLFGLVFHSRLGAPIKSLNGLVAPFFSSVALLFGLLTGFLANDVGDRNRQAIRAVQTEAGELRNVSTLSVASASDMAEIRVALKAYVNSAAHEEWPAIMRGQTSPRTDAAYDSLLREISDPSITRDASGAVHAALLGSAIRAGTARNDRLSLSGDRTNDLKWMSVLILGVITQIGLMLVHLDKPRAMLTALTVFATGAIVALGLIALQEHPFNGAFQVSPAPLERLLTLSEVGPNSALPARPEK